MTGRLSGCCGTGSETRSPPSLRPGRGPVLRRAEAIARPVELSAAFLRFRPADFVADGFFRARPEHPLIPYYYGKCRYVRLRLGDVYSGAGPCSSAPRSAVMRGSPVARMVARACLARAIRESGER